MLEGAFGSLYGLSETMVKTIPLILCGLGVAMATRMSLWNIGAEGQLYMGAFASAWVALFLTHLPSPVILPLMLVLGFMGGALWALIPGILKAKFSVNEIITTLSLNYVAILWVDYLVYGPWKDPRGYGFPLTATFPLAAHLPRLGNTRIHGGLLLGLLAALIIYLILKKTRWGYEVKVIGENPRAARYAGMNLERKILLVMFISGGLAGLAGVTEIAGIQRRLKPGFSPGYGYTAIIVTWLAKRHPLGVLVVAFLLGGLLVGGDTIKISLGIPAAMVNMIQGAILFFVLGGEILTDYRISWKGGIDKKS